MSPSKPIYFGPPPSVREGQQFRTHDALYAADVHRFRGRGISGTAHEGVDSIVASGGYADDEDLGDVIVYTAQGGSPDKDGRLTANQELSGVNQGMLINYREGLPIRYVRGLGIKRGKATGGYTYRGLYLIEGYWSVRTDRGHLMWQFRLAKAVAGERWDSDAEGIAVVEEVLTPLERVAARYVSTQRRVRNTAEARAIKSLYGNTCQMCRIPVVVDINGARYSEGAHIHALGRPHGGRDMRSNILCLCPNCHVLFDNGARLITDDFKVVDALSREVLGDLYVEPEHRIDRASIRQHRTRWADRSDDI
ncbi:YDG/SRA domain-containing protein [Streptomyces sp. RKAG290]|uniref:YDG/SRA domain-containing protein n=1 Tax=Streptomyces sp. RKAG290 TaxID=2888348 RepID=UPI0020337083|nr:YDG/SRA domain-containing protein [Streptomyces sp. RKAG290]MCM2413906.1 HNH endonuclease [Streptomyces sp. RKAG290]